MAPKLNWDLAALEATGRTSRLYIEEIRKWLKKGSFPDLTDEQIVMFLLSCNNALHATQNTITAYYKVKRQAPAIFDDRDIDREDLQHVQNVTWFGIVPNRTKENYAVGLHMLREFSFWKYNMVPSMKVLYMTLDAILLEKDPPKGLIVVMDMQGVGLLHLTRIKLQAMKQFFCYMQEALPVQLKAIHVFNVVFFIDKIMAIIKPFLNKELLDMLYFHHSGLDMNEFFEKHLQADCVPNDYGGTSSSVEEIHKNTMQKLRDHKDFFYEEERQRKQISDN